jgi:tetratricopeptide (TPR) repeat protein
MKKEDMMHLTKTVAFLLIVTALLPLQPRVLKAQPQQEILNQYISDLQKNPDDTAQREKIIKLAQTMKPAPAVPKEVIKHEGAAEYAFKNARSESDYLDSAREYEKALLLAPWLARDYFNCGMAYEKAGRFKEAITYFNFYLIAEPDAKDADVVLKRIGGLEYAAERTSKATDTAPVRQQDSPDKEKGLPDLAGTWYCPQINKYIRAEMSGRELCFTWYDQNTPAWCAVSFKNRELGIAVIWNQHVTGTATVSEDFNHIYYRERWSNGDVSDVTFNRQ